MAYFSVVDFLSRVRSGCFVKRESQERLGVVPGWFHVSYALISGGGFSLPVFPCL